VARQEAVIAVAAQKRNDAQVLEQVLDEPARRVGPAPAPLASRTLGDRFKKGQHSSFKATDMYKFYITEEFPWLFNIKS
jgi:hypothetical protein